MWVSCLTLEIGATKKNLNKVSLLKEGTENEYWQERNTLVETMKSYKVL